MAYEQYIEEQTRLFAPEEKEQQQKNLQIVYDDLVKRFHLLQDALKDEQARVERLEMLLNDAYNAYDTFKERVVEIPFSKIYNMFYMEQHPTALYMCVNDQEKLLWVKTPEEMK
jgi:ABC-type phosphate transport system auxiliary subunit